MKRLILVRHGKSSWKHDVQDDKRPLKKRAYKDAELVIKALKEKVEEPLPIWSSPATRALETAKIFKDHLAVGDEDFQIKEDLYTFDSKALLETIRYCDDSMSSLMLFGHNPAMTEVVNRLGNLHFDNVPTTGLAFIEFETDTWKNLDKGNTLFYLFPKNLR